MTNGDVTVIAGISVPSTSPVFLAIVGLHFLLGLTSTLAGIVAMLSIKRRGRHSDFGTIYFWCLSAVFASSTSLAVVRWTEDYHLFFIGLGSFAGRVGVEPRYVAVRASIFLSTSQEWEHPTFCF